MDNKVTEGALGLFASSMIEQQLQKGRDNGKEENGYLYANPFVLVGKAIQKAMSQNWPAAITYLAMAAAAWYGNKSEEEERNR